MTTITDIEGELEEFKSDSIVNSIAKSTLKVYVTSVKRFLKTNPNIENADDYINFLKGTVVLHYNHETGTKKRNLCYFDSLAKYCKYRKSIAEEPNIKSIYTKIIKLLKDTKPNQFPNKKISEYLTIKQRLNVIKHLKEYKHKLMAKLCMTLGVRVGSVLEMRAEPMRPAISFQSKNNRVVGVIDFHKMKGGKTSRKYIFDDDFVEELQVYLDTSFTDDEYYFLEKGKCYKNQTHETVLKTNYHWYWQDLREALQICGYNYEQWSTHCFRKNAAQDIYDETRDPYAVKEFLDHSDFRATEHYLKSQGLIKNQIDLQEKFSDKIKKEENID